MKRTPDDARRQNLPTHVTTGTAGRKPEPTKEATEKFCMGFFNNADAQDAKDRDRWALLAEKVTAGLRNFQILGAALKEIRDGQLYRFEYETFEICCEAKWKITARHASRLVVAFETAKEIGPTGQEVSERHLRPLSVLPVDERKAAYEEAQQDGGTPAAIQRAVRKRRPLKKSSALKPLRLKVPGGTVVITPNRRAGSHEQMLADASRLLTARHADAA